MSDLVRFWAGKVYGTNTGNLFADLNANQENITGSIRFMDDRFGPVVYEVEGKFEESVLTLNGHAVNPREGMETGELLVEGNLTAEGNIRGSWSSTIGTGGTFVLLPHEVGEPKRDNVESTLPERMHTANRNVGAVRLYSDDIVELINFLKKDFTRGLVVVTYFERGNEKSEYEEDFRRNMPKLGQLRYLKLLIREPEAYGIDRIAVVELNARTQNEIRTQGVQESWVVGKVEALHSYLSKYEKSFVTTFRKFGIGINQLIGVAALVLVPELSLNDRILFVVVLILISYAIIQSHSRYIPNALIYLSSSKPGAFGQAWPQILSWFIAASATLFATIVYGVLKGDFPKLLSWFSNLIS